MDSAFITGFLDQFIGIIDTGFGLIEGDVGFVLNALIVISVTLERIFEQKCRCGFASRKCASLGSKFSRLNFGAQWALSAEAPMAPFFRKVLFVGLFAFFINNWNALATALNQSGAMLGLRAGGGALTLADLHNPARVAGVGVELFGRTAALGEGLNILTDFFPLATIFLAALLVMLGFFVLALQLFTALIAFKLGSLAAFIALPWGVFSGTAWVAERPPRAFSKSGARFCARNARDCSDCIEPAQPRMRLGLRCNSWVVGSAVRLFVLALIASVSISFVASLPGAFSLDAGGVLNVLLFGLTMLTLSWFGPQLASEVVSGQPQLSGADGVRAAQGAAVTGIALGAGGTLAAKAGVRTAGALIKGARGIASRFGGAPGGGTKAIDHTRMQPKPRGR